MSAGWSWSPTRARALAQLNQNIQPLQPIQPIPQPNFAPTTLPGIASLDPYILPASVPRSAHFNENIAPPVTAGHKPKLASPAFPPPAPHVAHADKPAAASKKRKSDAGSSEKEELFPNDAPEIDDEDPRLYQGPRETCNAVRRKIRNWIDSGAMKVGEFQNAIGVSSKAYTSFMNRTGTWDGEGCDTYTKAAIYFRKRELQGLPIKLNKPKKAKTTASGKKSEDVDVSDIKLDGEDRGNVPIYDTCDEVRKKARAYLAKEGVTQASFTREISKTFRDERKVSAANLRYFMGQKGPLGGNVNITFYAAYVFFEKLRIKQGKAKTKFREEMEKVHGSEGVDTEHGQGAHITCFGNERPYIDKYARLQFTPA